MMYEILVFFEVLFVDVVVEVVGNVEEFFELVVDVVEDEVLMDVMVVMEMLVVDSDGFVWFVMVDEEMFGFEVVDIMEVFQFQLLFGLCICFMECFGCLELVSCGDIQVSDWF